MQSFCVRNSSTSCSEDFEKVLLHSCMRVVHLKLEFGSIEGRRGLFRMIREKRIEHETSWGHCKDIEHTHPGFV